MVADLEGTCTTGETWRAVGGWLTANGRRGRYRRFLVPRLAALPLVRLGLVSRQGFRDRWIRDLARLLAGLAPDDVARVAEEVVDGHLWPGRRVAVIAELEAVAAAGARVAIASGTYQPVLDAFITRLKVGPAGQVTGLGTPLEIVAGRTTGRLAAPIGTGRRKADRVRAWSEGAPLAAAYGDSLADVPLLEMASEPVAVAPDATSGRWPWRADGGSSTTRRGARDGASLRAVRIPARRGGRVPGVGRGRVAPVRRAVGARRGAARQSTPGR